MDKTTWQQQLHNRAGQFKDWLTRRANRDAPYVVYGGLMASTLWPVIESVAQSGNIGTFWVGLTGAVGAAAAGAGASLIANQIEAWKGRADRLTQDEVAEWVTTQAAGDSDMRDLFNRLLVELNGVAALSPHLSAADQQWLADTLRQELTRLGTPSNTIEAIIGSGNLIIQGSELTAGDESIVASIVGRDAITGHNVTVQNIEQQVVQDQPGPAPEALLADYLHNLFEECRQLPLSQLDKTVTREMEASLNLSSVYTALLTSSPKWQEKEGRLPRGVEGHVLDSKELRSALELLNDEKYLVLLGDPGSGKTTFVNFVTTCLAGERLGKTEANLARLTAPLPDDDGRDQAEPQPWQYQALLPVRIILREFAARGLPPPDQTATVRHLWDFINSELADSQLEAFGSHLDKHLHEQGGLLLLDGLDEVPEAHQRREQLRQVIEGFRKSYSRCRILVTCRVYAYQNEAWKLSNFKEARLAPFSRGQIIRFVEHWYERIVTTQRGLSSDEAKARAGLLKQAIFNRPRLHDLAQRPLLLALMAQLHAYGQGSLPERRERLYGAMVELLLDRWERPKLRRTSQGQLQLEAPALTQWLAIDQEQVLEFLEGLAFEIHRDQADQADTADISQARLAGGLMELSKKRGSHFDLLRLVEYLEGRAGLLVPQGEAVYRFPHRTIQEYLAACHLVNETYPDPLAELARGDPDRWREVALLAAANAGRQTIWNLVEALCWQDPPVGEAVLTDVWGAHLAAQALVEVADIHNVPERHYQKLQRVKAWLIYILDYASLPATERAIAGQHLAHLGDDRPGVGLRPDGLPDIIWCDVPSGPFLFGDNKKKVALPAFRMSRYPITNAQFEAFVQDGGYTEQWRRCWTKAGWQNKRDRQQPNKYGGVYDLPNHPVVGVDWYEAVAYCRWLTVRLRALGALGQDEEISLPTDSQWEKAARGTDGRKYPWGDPVDPDRANYDDTGIGTTSAVGCFAQGASPYGCFDMSGNVWEWCRTKHDDLNDNNLEGTAPRVLRGGAFNYNRFNVRCAARFSHNPGYSYFYYGFRLVVSPFTSDR